MLWEQQLTAQGNTAGQQSHLSPHTTVGLLACQYAEMHATHNIPTTSTPSSASMPRITARAAAGPCKCIEPCPCSIVVHGGTPCRCCNSVDKHHFTAPSNPADRPHLCPWPSPRPPPCPPALVPAAAARDGRHPPHRHHHWPEGTGGNNRRGRLCRSMHHCSYEDTADRMHTR